MNSLPDTNVVREAARPQPGPMGLDWIADQNGESLFISAFTPGEWQRGALIPTAGKQRKDLPRWIETGITTDLAGRILAVDVPVMERRAPLEAGTASAPQGRSGRRHSPGPPTPPAPDSRSFAIR